MAAAEQIFPSNSTRAVSRFDLTDYTEARLICNVQILGAVSGIQVNLQYHTAFSATASDYTPIGTSAIACSLEATGLITSAWVPLVAAARADVVLAVIQVGGDAAADPSIGNLRAQFR